MSNSKLKKILIACEESQTICAAFRILGFNAYSCDILPSSGEYPEFHIQGDVVLLLQNQWDLIIAHPPCTYLSNAGIAWFNVDKYGLKAEQRKLDRLAAEKFFMHFVNANANFICIENPVGWMNSQYRKPDQIIQPYMFGDNESKRTCLWLKGLPKLVPTEIVQPKIFGYYKKGKKIGKPIYWCDYMAPGKDRAKQRSKTFPGIANAMAQQWGEFLLKN